jgi:hypothetical protein
MVEMVPPVLITTREVEVVDPPIPMDLEILEVQDQTVIPLAEQAVLELEMEAMEEQQMIILHHKQALNLAVVAVEEVKILEHPAPVPMVR